MSNKKEKNGNKNLKSFFFDIHLIDEHREETIEIEARDEREAWGMLPKACENKYEGRRWYYTGRFIIKEK